MKESLNRLVAIFNDDKQIEHTFNFIIWISITALLTRGAVILFYTGEYVASILIFFLVFFLFWQLSTFGFRHIMLPIMSALFPDTDYVKSNQLFLGLDRPKRISLFKRLFFTPQSFLFITCYLGLYYIMYKLFTAFSYSAY
ncbi:MAG: hypothetical protein OEY06_12825 [Gammaproteobacteria bacterium]|nr:hypothetical protein [Gammaproteobacteria bacterium]